MAAWLRAPTLVRGALGGLVVLLAGCATAPDSGGGTGAPASELADPERFGTLMRLGDAARRSGDWAGAASLYRQATAVDPTAPRGHVALGEALLESGNPGPAARSFQEALRLAPGDRDAARGHARTLIELGRPDEAVARYTELVEADPTDARAFNGLGVAHDLAGRHDEAQAAYRRGLAVEPDDLALRNNLALSLVLAGRPREAIPILDRVIGSPGATARNRQNLALAYGLAGDLATAERLGRVDLDDRTVRQNLAFYAEVRGRDAPADVAPAPAPERAPPVPARPEGRTTPGNAGPATSAPAAPPPEAPVTRPIVIKLEAQLPNRAAAGEPGAVTTGPAPAADDRARAVADAAAPARPATADAEPDRDSAAPGAAADAVAVEGHGVALGSSGGGSWFLELGEYADGQEAAAVWRDLRRRHGALLSTLNRLASIHGGRQQLLVGPVASGAEARDLCRRLKGAGQTCRAVLL